MLNKKAEQIVNSVFETTADELIILESQLKNHPSSEKTFVAVKAKNWISASGSSVTQKLNGQLTFFKGNPWNCLKQFRKKTESWLFGYLGYDLKNHIENLTSENQSLIDCPDLFFMEPETLLEIKNDDVYVHKGNVNWTKFQPQSNRNSSLKISASYSPLIDKSHFINIIDAIKNKIKDGDFYELNYTYPITGIVRGSALELYKRMRVVNPVPFGAFLRIGDICVSCASPERFLKRVDNKILSEPIKGTANRLENDRMDSLMRKELMNEKNRAENLMIVDLVRHDMSKFSKTGSVKVSKLYDLQSFETVHQLISSIECDVDKKTDSIDIIKSCFPMGSMTGAPKIEVMKNIEKLESYRRGIYSGAIGYFEPNGNFDFNVVIRSAILRGNKMVFPVGGAITSDSDPNSEWEETEIKLKSLTNVFS